MKTKFLITLLFILISKFVNAQTQEFAPIGAKWWYDYIAQFGPEYGYVQLESTKDTVIDLQPCRELKQTLFLYLPWADIVDTIPQPSFFVYNDSDEVYYYDVGAFYPLYNFGSLPGDVWYYENYDLPWLCPEWPYANIIVSDTGTFTEGIISLRNISVTTPDSSGVGFTNGESEIIDRIGSTYFFTPVYTYCPTDDYRGGPLRCYQDSTVFVSFYDDEDTAVTAYGCDPFVMPDFIPALNNSNIAIFPNPARDKIYFKFQNNSSTYIHIMNIIGNQFETKMNWGNTYGELDIRSYPAGVYILNIFENNLLLTSQKFIKY